ncbi:hypothetical protein P153DRAFT_196242 [Dothidotthia symphoricarpi CBS 119687]|uniref:Uncharacterized protein n=1 Tax=Dothidotthia symphoricarpi CBS 119687 TaxID=1392245 RepID=A0A6A6ALX5_9PLEO|nr:uncharacterized protein P153DRAFT_196242 [Dothidotthia symphoricarpi CBS 119687]KAF2131481.1 hypothetical protein P153DRAFT_196242 [Dothidotthia symphoricarpi CBS 119687]
MPGTAHMASTEKSALRQSYTTFFFCSVWSMSSQETVFAKLEVFFLPKFLKKVSQRQKNTTFVLSFLFFSLFASHCYDLCTPDIDDVATLIYDNRRCYSNIQTRGTRFRSGFGVLVAWDTLTTRFFALRYVVVP